MDSELFRDCRWVLWWRMLRSLTWMAPRSDWQPPSTTTASCCVASWPLGSGEQSCYLRMWLVSATCTPMLEWAPFYDCGPHAIWQPFVGQLAATAELFHRPGRISGLIYSNQRCEFRFWPFLHYWLLSCKREPQASVGGTSVGLRSPLATIWREE